MVLGFAVGMAAGMVLGGGGNESVTKQESVTNISNNFTSAIASSVVNSMNTETNINQNMKIKIIVGGDTDGMNVRAVQNADANVQATMHAMASIDNSQSATIANEITNTLDKVLEQSNSGLLPSFDTNTSVTDQKTVSDISNEVQQSISNSIRNTMSTMTSIDQTMEIDLEFRGNASNISVDLTQDTVTAVVASQISDITMTNTQSASATNIIVNELKEKVSQKNTGLDLGMIAVIIALGVVGKVMTGGKKGGKGVPSGVPSGVPAGGPLGKLIGGGGGGGILLILILMILVFGLVCVYCTIGWFMPEKISTTWWIRTPIFNLPQSGLMKLLGEDYEADDNIYDPNPTGPGGAGGDVGEKADPMWFFGDDGVECWARIVLEKMEREYLKRAAAALTEADAAVILGLPVCRTTEANAACDVATDANGGKRGTQRKLGECIPTTPVEGRCVDADKVVQAGVTESDCVSPLVWDTIQVTANETKCISAMNRPPTATALGPFTDNIATSDAEYYNHYKENCEMAYTFDQVEDPDNAIPADQLVVPAGFCTYQDPTTDSEECCCGTCS